jgi:ABC-2 type transport system ATP-binding protein
MNMVTGLLKPSGGMIRVFGRDVWKEPLAAKGLLGYVAERPIVYEQLTGREFVMFLAELYRTPRVGLEERVEQLLAGFDLADAADVLIRTYSQGMRRKIALAAAVVHSPDLLVLDEPTNGVDPRGAWVIKNLLRSIAEQGAAVLMSTHVLEVAETMCDRVAIIDRGRIVAEGTINDLKEQSRMPESNLEEIFLALTLPGNDQERVLAIR